MLGDGPDSTGEGKGMSREKPGERALSTFAPQKSPRSIHAYQYEQLSRIAANVGKKGLLQSVRFPQVSLPRNHFAVSLTLVSDAKVTPPRSGSRDSEQMIGQGLSP